MTSGPGTVPTPGCLSGGNEADVTLPFSSRWLISIGSMVAPSEIWPATEPVSDGRPRAFANSLETSRRPPVMLSELSVGIVIVLIAFDIEENEPGLAVAHGKIERCAGRKFFHYELPNGSA